jgi:hypothetical protein
MTREVFDVQMGRMVVLRGMPGDTDEYFAALCDVPDDVLTAAIGQAIRSRPWFPTPAELRADCDAVKSSVRPVRPEPAPQARDLADARMVEIRNPLPGGASIWVRVVREWKHDCDTCSDTGWASRRCPETGCGRRFDHGPHEFVEMCGCVEWNPTIRRRKESQVKYHQKPEAA